MASPQTAKPASVAREPEDRAQVPSIRTPEAVRISPSPTTLARLRHHAKGRPGAVAFAAKAGDRWVTTTWSQFDGEIRQAGRALIALGLPPGATVGILGFNRPEWTLSYLGAMTAGAVPVGIYLTCAPNQVAYVASHAEMRVIVVENEDQLEKVRQVRGELPALEHVVMMAGVDVADGDDAISWDAFMALGDPAHDETLDERTAALGPDQLATLIYTSGTTGTPKGVMLTHANVTETARICDRLHGLGGEDRTLSYLPLAHIAEQMISIHLALYSGFAVYYAESLEHLADNLREVEPTIFFGVPRVWERIHAGVLAKLETAPSLRRRLALWALGAGTRAATERFEGREPSGFLALEQRVAERLVLSKLRRRLGLAKVELAASGAAPIRRDVLDFFAAAGITIYEVYGLSETTGPATWNYDGVAKLGTVGPVLPEVELEIAGDGEVLFRGPNIFQGYFKSPEATAEALDEDGWLHTGDLGRVDGEGYLSITGRKKELIITSGGKNIAPVGIEAALKRHELIAEAVVIGDARKFLSALLTLEPEAAARFAAVYGIEGPLHESPRLIEELERGVDAVNATFARVEHIRKFRVLPRVFSLEDGELTPTLKLRRQVIAESWAEVIEGMYGD